ncbi:MAG: Gfo/Idh/MocA family oxidoreductase [Rhodospirillaceae bacterium]|nr:Gfo/Idh/MocA family oxidoreductase [Rhodospirillaceae bacterium]MBT5242929.1 Gfo/Idh/MocA family oxidoreductase [Rhodospirillaceae bacterium]MBT6243468.1 Gfo/Idh/MocA family oxidoreductase [Rhodospirillaceae bacterium]MBT7138314.1 Gfo/Idh/MocA family oxidoreductase [Rhodospirillaceae bacterium]
MPNKQLSVALIGAGQIAGGYDTNLREGEDGVYSHAGAYKADGRFSLTTVYDLDDAAAQTFQSSWNVIKIAGGIDDILGTHHDVVSVCVPDETHFDIVHRLITTECCKTVFVEKPLASSAGDIATLDAMSRAADINVVVNFQRRFDSLYAELAAEFAADPTRIITVNAMYMNGFEHVGVTMLDTLDALFGAPGAVYVYNAVINLENNQLTYEFVLYYDNFNITVKTVDSSIHAYNYHIFDIDIFLADGRLTLNQTGRWLERRTVGDYAYSGVSVFEEDSKRSEKTGWDKSMIAAVDYIARVTRGGAHTINTPAQSQRTRRILDAIIKSAETETKINVNEIS